MNEAAVPVIPKRKSESEICRRSPYYTIEAMMSDTKALQSGTTHNLGQPPKAFDIQYLMKITPSSTLTTSWGLSTRFIKYHMTHGDDQVGLTASSGADQVIVPIFRKAEERAVRKVERLKVNR